MTDLPDRLRDYITVAERVEAFLSKYPEGSLQADLIELNETRVVMRGYAYRSADDLRPGIGYSSMPIPAKNRMLVDSEIETCETSAWGRAIAALGFEVRKGVASKNEIDAKTTREEPREGSLVGVAKVGERTTSDGQLRQTPTGHRLGFRLESREGDKGGILVEANDDIAVALAETRDKWFNQPVTAWGLIEQREFVPKGRTKPVVYQALVLSKIQTPNGTIPSTGKEGSGDLPEAGAEAAGVTESAPDEAQALPVPPEAAGASSPEPAALSPGSAPDDQCDSASPYGDNAQCELLAGHKGAHAVLSQPFPEKWTDR